MVHSVPRRFTPGGRSVARTIPALAPIVLALLGPSSARVEPLLETREKARTAFLARDWDTAASAYRGVAEQSPHDGAIWRSLGYAYLQLASYDDAIAAYQRAIRTGESVATCYYDIACANALAARTQPALDALASAYAAGFCNEHLVHSDADLASLRASARFAEIVGLPDPAVTDRRERWQRDLALLERRLREVHWRPFRVLTESEFETRLGALEASIDDLDDLEMRLRVQGLLASIGDGHTAVASDFFAVHHGAGGADARFLPVELFDYDDGVRIVAATAEHADLIGSRVRAIGGQEIDAAVAAMQPYVSRDNEWGARWGVMQALGDPKALHGLGLGRVDEGFDFEVETLDGARRTVHLEAGGVAASHRVSLHEAIGVAPTLFERDKSEHLFLSPMGNALYVRIDGIRDGHETFEQFTERIFATAGELGARALVLDLRDNLGGQGHLTQPLLHRILASDYNARGRLYVIVGRKTFSAAMAFAAQLDLHTAARFVGEPTGSRPNFVGETSLIRLPHSGLWVSLSSRYHQNGASNDSRLWIAPHLPAPPSFDAARAGRDTALELVETD